MSLEGRSGHPGGRRLQSSRPRRRGSKSRSASSPCRTRLAVPKLGASHGRASMRSLLAPLSTHEETTPQDRLGSADPFDPAHIRRLLQLELIERAGHRWRLTAVGRRRYRKPRHRYGPTTGCGGRSAADDRSSHPAGELAPALAQALSNSARPKVSPWPRCDRSRSMIGDQCPCKDWARQQDRPPSSSRPAR